MYIINNTITMKSTGKAKITLTNVNTIERIVFPTRREASQVTGIYEQKFVICQQRNEPIEWNGSKYVVNTEYTVPAVKTEVWWCPVCNENFTFTSQYCHFDSHIHRRNLVNNPMVKLLGYATFNSDVRCRDGNIIVPVRPPKIQIKLKSLIKA